MNYVMLIDGEYTLDADNTKEALAKAIEFVKSGDCLKEGSLSVSVENDEGDYASETIVISKVA
jgi:hypothetical protein